MVFLSYFHPILLKYEAKGYDDEIDDDEFLMLYEVSRLFRVRT